MTDGWTEDKRQVFTIAHPEPLAQVSKKINIFLVEKKNALY